MADPGPRVVLYPRQSTMLAYAFASLLLVLAGFLVIVCQEKTNIYSNAAWAPWVPWCVGCLDIAFFGMCLGSCVRRAAVHRPSLTIDDEGLRDNASEVGVGLVRWEEIAAISPHRILTSLCVRVVLKDFPAVLARQSRIKRSLLRFNRIFAPASVLLPAAMLGRPVEEVISEIRQHLDAKEC